MFYRLVQIGQGGYVPQFVHGFVVWVSECKVQRKKRKPAVKMTKSDGWF